MDPGEAVEVVAVSHHSHFAFVACKGPRVFKQFNERPPPRDNVTFERLPGKSTSTQSFNMQSRWQLNDVNVDAIFPMATLAPGRQLSVDRNKLTSDSEDEAGLVGSFGQFESRM